MAKEPKKIKTTLKSKKKRTTPAPKIVPIALSKEQPAVHVETNTRFKNSLESLSSKLEIDVSFQNALSDPKISVVIVNRNGSEYLSHCLFALKTQTQPVHEIILVDNGSSDDSVEYTRTNYPHIQILESGEDLGTAMGTNLGARCATGDLVAVLANSMVPTPDWLGRLVLEFQQQWPQVGTVSSWVLSSQKLNDYSFGFSKMNNFLGDRIEIFVEKDWTEFAPDGRSFVYARHWALEGPFNPDYRSEQMDVYFGWKTRLMGKSVAIAMDAKIFQKETDTSSRVPAWKAIYYGNRNRWMNLFVFYNGANLIRVMPWVFMDMLGRLLSALLLDLSGLLGTVLALFWIAFHLPAIAAKRRNIQQKRRTPDREITCFMSGKVLGERAKLAPLVNGLSLIYCRLVGLRVWENKPRKVAE